jgi:hypothetical protein
VRSAILLAVALGVLFLMAWQAHEVADLQRLRTELQQRVNHDQDELSRLRVAWYRATRREVVIERAEREIGLAEPGPDEREVVAIRWLTPPRRESTLFARLREGLDRYGEIPGAWAEETGR